MPAPTCAARPSYPPSPIHVNSVHSRRHTCHVVRRVCFSQRKILVDEDDLTPVESMRVRGVHVGFDISPVGSLGLFEYVPPSQASPSLHAERPLLVVRRHRKHSSIPRISGYSQCVPLVWWPLWGYNIGEFFQNSVLSLAELQAARVVDTDVLITPEVGGWPLRDYHFGMLEAFSTHVVKTTAQLAPKCGAAAGQSRVSNRTAKCPPPRCFEQMLVCKFRDVYDGDPPIAPWSAAHAIVAAMRSPRPILPLRESKTAFSVVCSAGPRTPRGLERSRRSVL